MLKLNINEACNLANNIEKIKLEFIGLMENELYNLNIKEKHNRKKFYDQDEDEVINPNEDKEKYDVTIETILKIIEALKKEKALLSMAIEEAKYVSKIKVNDMNLSVNVATEYNKYLRSEIMTLSYINKIKNSKNKTFGNGFKYDNDLKQTQYKYEIEIEKNISFDKKETMKKEKELKELATLLSKEIEKIKINTVIELDTKLELSDNIEDIINKFK